MKLTEARIRQIIIEELEAFNEEPLNEEPLEEADQLDLSKLAPLADAAAEKVMGLVDDMAEKAAGGNEGVAAAVKQVIFAKITAEG